MCTPSHTAHSHHIWTKSHVLKRGLSRKKLKLKIPSPFKHRSISTYPGHGHGWNTIKPGDLGHGSASGNHCPFLALALISVSSLIHKLSFYHFKFPKTDSTRKQEHMLRTLSFLTLAFSWIQKQSLLPEMKLPALLCQNKTAFLFTDVSCICLLMSTVQRPRVLL